MKKQHKALLLALLAGACFWVLDAVLDSFFFYQQSFLDMLILNVPPVELYMRLTALVVALVFVLIGSAGAAKRKRAKKELRSMKDYTENIINSMANMLLVVSPEGKIVTVNEATCKLLGFSEHELISQPATVLFQEEEEEEEEEEEDSQFIISEQALPVKRTVLRRLVREGSVSNIEKSLLTKNREKIPVLLSGSVMRDEQGEIQGIVCLALDITDRKKSENTLRESEEKFRLAMVASNDALWDWNIVTNQVYRNPRHATMLGHEPDEIPPDQSEWEKRVHPDDRETVFRILKETLEGKRESFELEYRLRAKSGDYVWVLGRAKVVAHTPDGSPSRMIGTNIDITERKQAEEDIRQYQKRLQSLAVKLSLTEDQERRRLASSLHDNAGQLLSLAKIKLSTLDKPSLPAEVNQSLAEIEELVGQAEMSTRALTFQIYNPALHDLGFEPAVEWLAENIQESYGLKVDVANDGQYKPMDEPLRVVMFQCLREVLVNVAKHARVDRAKVDIVRHDQFVRVAVEDQGVGFDSQVAPEQNHGFGLFSIRERIAQLGGHVEIKSSPGQGTTIILEGPIRTDENRTTRKKP